MIEYNIRDIILSSSLTTVFLSAFIYITYKYVCYNSNITLDSNTLNSHLHDNEQGNADIESNASTVHS
jgi:hypothetical protein